MALACKKCPYVVAVPPGERPPPWCPRCGADLKAAEPTAAVSPNAPQAAGTWDAAGPSGAFGEAKSTTPTAEKTLPSEPPVAASHTLPVSSDSQATTPIPEQVFRGNRLWQVVSAVTLLLCLGIVAIAASQLIHPRPGKPIQSGVYGVLGLFGIGALIAGYVTFRLFGQKYAVSNDGLIEWRHFAPTRYRWEQIREVFTYVHPAWTKYRLVTRGGGELDFSGEIRHYKKLGEVIAAKVAEQLLPAALAELEAGRDVRFGPLRVNRAGVVIDGQLEPWHRIGVLHCCLNPNPIRGTAIVSNMLHLRLGTSWVELGDIPNYRLFEEVAGKLFPAAVATAANG